MNKEDRGGYDVCTLSVPLCNLNSPCAHPVIWFNLSVEEPVLFYGTVAVHAPRQRISLNRKYNTVV